MTASLMRQRDLILSDGLLEVFYHREYGSISKETHKASEAIFEKLVSARLEFFTCLFLDWILLSVGKPTRVF